MIKSRSGEVGVGVLVAIVIGIIIIVIIGFLLFKGSNPLSGGVSCASKGGMCLTPPTGTSAATWDCGQSDGKNYKRAEAKCPSDQTCCKLDISLE